MHRGIRQDGLVLVMALLILLLGIGAWAVAELAAGGIATRREAISDRALARAREALIAYSAERPITAWVGPGYLPCPDRDDDGWAESTCGSQSGHLGQDERLGRLPWKTLGLPDLRDGHGERLWYAVSSKYKGLLNCAPSRACLDMSPDSALGTITVRDASGTLLHDGRSADIANLDRSGAVAVVIAPGPALTRVASGAGAESEQKRECPAGECDATGRCVLDPPTRTAKCHPANYLDRAPGSLANGEDNADFVDRNDAPGRAGNGNGFVQGPVRLPDGRVAVNDRVAPIAYHDVMPRIMRRVALEVAHCLRFYASRPENAGRYPFPTPACRQALADPSIAWADATGVLFGRIPDSPFERSRVASGGTMLERWWRAHARSPEALGELPVRDGACRIAFPPDDEGDARRLLPGSPAAEGRTAGLSENAWWSFWKPFVFYALAASHQPSLGAARACTAAECLTLVDETGAVRMTGKHFAVVVGGAALPGRGQRHAGTLATPAQWLEGANPELDRRNPDPPAPECPQESARAPCPGCLRVTLAARTSDFNDVVVAFP